MAAKPTAKNTKAAKNKRTKKPAPAATGTDLVRRITWDRIAKKKNHPAFDTGDSVHVHVKVKEGEKERVQIFSGVVIKVQGSGVSRSFTVRKISSGVGVERSFPVMSPIIDKIEVVTRGKVRRGRLFYLRGLKGRSARLNSEVYVNEDDGVGAADEIATEPAASDAAPEAKAEKKEKKADKAKAPAKS